MSIRYFDTYSLIQNCDSLGFITLQETPDLGSAKEGKATLNKKSKQASPQKSDVKINKKISKPTLTEEHQASLPDEAESTTQTEELKKKRKRKKEKKRVVRGDDSYHAADFHKVSEDDTQKNVCVEQGEEKIGESKRKHGKVKKRDQASFILEKSEETEGIKNTHDFNEVRRKKKKKAGKG